MSDILKMLREDNNWIWCIIGIVLLVTLGFIVYMIASYTPLMEGTVVAKFYEPSRSVYSPSHVTIDGKDQTIHNYRYESEKFKLVIENGDDKDIWFVTEEFYSNVKVGDFVTK